MLREVMKRFTADNNVELKPGDIVDVSGWKNRTALEDQHYIAPTDATKATIDTDLPKKRTTESKTSSPTRKQPARIRRSALASRPRVFR